MLTPREPISLRADGVTVRFRDGSGLLWPIRLDVPAGATVALTGSNGSGKSTFIRVCAGLIEPTKGTVHWLDGERQLGLSDVRPRLGYVPQSGGLVPAMRVVDYLSYICWMKRIGPADRAQQIERVLGVVDLLSVAGRKVRALSGGMQRRVLVAQGLLGSPGLLLLDEPTAGLDAEQCGALREALRRVSGSVTILLATHVPDDLPLADQVVPVGTASAEVS